MEKKPKHLKHILALQIWDEKCIFSELFQSTHFVISRPVNWHAAYKLADSAN